MLVNGRNRRDVRTVARSETRFTRRPRFRNLLRRGYVALLRIGVPIVPREVTPETIRGGHPEV